MQMSTVDGRPVPLRISDFRDTSIALNFADRDLTYGELDRMSNQFAAYLSLLGVEPGATVAICLERSFDWIVAALATMRIGAAYVPLDSAWPDTRLRFAVNDSGAAVLVARQAVLDRLHIEIPGIDPSVHTMAIDTVPVVQEASIEPESLAYIIYTSGTTGVPKGVEITHANLSHLVRWHVDAFGVMRQDKVSHLAGLGFDAAGWEIWSTLSAGATLCLVQDEVRTSPELIQEWMIRERISIGFVPTVHAAPMMAMQWPGTTKLRYLLTGGDALHQAPPVGLPFNVVNNYGPSECTVVATSSVLVPGSQGLPPIGRPIAGTSVYLLDEKGNQVTDGDVGEIYIGGNSVACGYRNLPELTERSFVPDSFAGTAGARMYRSGDRGSRLPNGEIEFHGRIDRQIKIRGQRIELDEIGSALTQHPKIEFAAAMSKLSAAGENQLWAYILPRNNQAVFTVDEVQEYLLRSLPDYMIPAYFVRLRTLPLSSNGKLDLNILGQITDHDFLERTAEQPVASPIEEDLLVLMRGLLENQNVGPNDNFFLAGGHSLLGMQLVMRLRKTYGVDLTLQQLFKAPTVVRLAALIQALIIADIDSMTEDEAQSLLAE
jgi:amino acid adenylation domain-containing protein